MDNHQQLETPASPQLAPPIDDYDRRYFNAQNGALNNYFRKMTNVLAALFGPAGGKHMNNPYGGFQSTVDQTPVANVAQVMRFDTTDFTNGISLGSHTAVFTASRALTVLTVTAVTSNTIYLGMTITGTGIASGTTITAFGTGTGGTGTYTTSTSGTLTGVTVTGTIQSKIVVDQGGVYNLQWSGQFQNTDNAHHDVSVWLRQDASGSGTDITGSNGIISVPARKSASPGDEGNIIIGWNYFITLDTNDFIELWWSVDSTAVTLQAYPTQSSPTRPSTASLITTMTFVSNISA